MNIAQMAEVVKNRIAARAVEMPDSAAALEQLFSGYLRLREMGWEDIAFAPRDGTHVDVVVAGATCVQTYHHNGIGWQVSDRDDMFAGNPILFRLIPEVTA